MGPCACGNVPEPNARFCNNCGAAVRQAEPVTKRYPALRAIAYLHVSIAVLLLLAGMIVLLAVWTDTSMVGWLKLLVSIGVIMLPLFEWGAGELILVLLDIEENTRASRRDG